MENPDNFVNFSASNWFAESWLKTVAQLDRQTRLVLGTDFRNLTHWFVPPDVLPIALKICGEDIADDRKQPRFKRARRLIGVSGLEDREQRFLADVIDVRLINTRRRTNRVTKGPMSPKRA